MNASILLDHLTFAYAGASRPALSAISGRIAPGSVVAVLGAAGAGKSTLCGAFNGLVPQFFRGDYTGTVTVAGRNAAATPVSDMARAVGYLFQDFEAQLFSSSVEMEVAFGLENLCLPRDEMASRIAANLAFAGLADKRHRETATLSGGEKQRLALASVLAMAPEVLVLDEAMTDVDPEGRGVLLALAEMWRRRQGILVYADFEAETALQADQIWLMKEGQCVAQGPPAAILRDVALLKSCGVALPPLAALFAALGRTEAPLTLDEALPLMNERRGKRMGGKRQPSAAENPALPVVLEARKLTHRYPGRPEAALQGVSLQVRAGEFVAILGRNGSGKTTLAKHFNGLLSPHAGEILLDGRPLSACPRHDVARQVGYVFQNPDHQIFAPTVREEVAFGPRMLDFPQTRREANIAEALEATGLSGRELDAPFLLTRGERQRVAVASILAVKPQVIILDEPTTGLDASQQREAMAMLQRLNAQGHTVIIITHAMDIVEEYASRVVVLKNGRVTADGPTRQVFADEALLHDAGLAPSPLARLANCLSLEGLSLAAISRELAS